MTVVSTLIRVVKTDRSYQLLIVVLFLASFLRFYRVGSDIFNDDAQFWFARSITHIEALKELDFEDTFINTKPGVTIQWLTGLSLDIFLNLYNKIFHFKPLLYTAETFRWVDLAAKSPLILLTILFLPFLYAIIEKNLNRDIAIFTTIFLAFEPFYIGISRWLHVEGILAVFMPVSVFLFIQYLFDKNKKWLLLSGIASGLALLTKSPAVFLWLFIPLSFLVYSTIYKSTNIFKQKIKFFVRDYLAWLLITLVTFILLFPAMWVQPVEVVGRIIGDTIYTGSVGRNNIEGPLFYSYAFFMRTSPLLILSFLGGLFVLIKRYKKLPQKTRLVLVLSGLFVFFYFLMMSLAAQKMDRYLLTIYPFIAIIASFGVVSLLASFESKHALVLGMVIICQFAFALYYTPYFTTYYNPLLGGRETASKLWRVESTGQLYPEVAKWVNSHDNPYELNTVVNYTGHSLRPYILGKVFSKNENLPEGLEADFFIVPWDQTLSLRWQQCFPMDEIRYHGDLYWTIYGCNEKWRGEVKSEQTY